MTPPVSGILTQQIVSAMGVLEPDKLDKLMAQYADQGASFFQEMNRFGFIKEVAQTQYSQFEQERFHSVFQVVGPVAAPAAGANLTVDVTPAYLINGATYPRVGDLVYKATNPSVRGRIEAKSGATLTIRPLNSTQTLGAVVNNDTWVIYSSAFGFGTGQPEPATTRVIERFNQTQIIKETIGAEGTVLTDAKWYQVSEEGKSGPSFWSEVLTAGEYRQYLKIDGAILWGDETDNIPGVQTTKGILPTAIDAEGNLGATTLNIAGFDSVDAYLRTVYAGKLVGVYLGQNKFREIENELQALFADQNIASVIRSSNNFSSEEAMLSATTQYKFLTRTGRVYMFMSLRQLDNPTTYNSYAGSPFNGFGLFVPMTETKDGMGQTSSYIGVRYKALGSYDRMMEVWADGAGHPGLKIGDLDQSLLYWRSDLGAHCLKANQWAFVQ